MQTTRISSERTSSVTAATMASVPGLGMITRSRHQKYAPWPTSPLRVHRASMALIAPVVAALIGYVALDQTLTALQLLGVAVILASVAITQWWAARRASPAADATAPPSAPALVSSGH